MGGPGKKLTATSLVPVPRPQPLALTRKRVWGHWRRFLVLRCKLNNHVIICIWFLLAHVQSRDGAQDQENVPMSTLFLMRGWGLGTRLTATGLVPKKFVRYV